MLKRDKLEEYYCEVNDCLYEMDEKVLSILNTYIPDILNVLDERRKRLKKRDYHLLVAGKWR
jgi:hypothetical protein